MKLIQIVRQLAKEHPDNVYKGPMCQKVCHYDKGTCTNGSIGCIFGQALKILLGKTVKGSDGITNLIVKLGIKATEKQMDWMKYVQACQDDGMPWHRAVSSANAAYGYVR